MFCPECQAEYRAGFTTCSDCQVELVDQLQTASNSNAASECSTLQEIWAGDSQENCVLHCTELREAKIPYQVIQHHLQVVKSVQDNYRIGVAAEFCEQAKKIIEQGNLDDANDPDFNPELELAPQDDKAPADVDDEHLDWKDETPDDATMGVWSGPTREAADLMVMALRENDIESRATLSSRWRPQNLRHPAGRIPRPRNYPRSGIRRPPPNKLYPRNRWCVRDADRLTPAQAGDINGGS